MKKEIELKILNIDPKKLRAKLKEVRGKQVLKPTLMRELYFELSAQKLALSSLRLRTEGKRSLITLKIKIEDKRFNVHDEYEIEVDDFNNAKKILELAGFEVFRQREKVREEYHIGKIRVEIDEYPRMKPYMEVEGSSKKEIEAFLKKLGFSLKCTTNKTATEVIRDAGFNPNNLLFGKKQI